jgi:uncharacterized protein Yka (UPF0111/DUF47 family)
MTTNIEELETQIDTVVREHIAACHQAAAMAVDRAFGSASRRTKPPGRARPKAAGSTRRTAEELAEVCERLYEAVRANPGEGMKVLMAEVGSTARELYRPMTQLKKAGRVRSVGQRHQSRYFPMAESR